MDSYSRIPRHSISHDLLTFGHEGLGVNRANERRAAEQDRDRITATLRESGSPSSSRRWARASTSRSLPAPNISAGIRT